MFSLSGSCLQPHRAQEYCGLWCLGAGVALDTIQTLNPRVAQESFDLGELVEGGQALLHFWGLDRPWQWGVSVSRQATNRVCRLDRPESAQRVLLYLLFMLRLQIFESVNAWKLFGTIC